MPQTTTEQPTRDDGLKSVDEAIEALQGSAASAAGTGESSEDPNGVPRTMTAWDTAGVPEEHPHQAGDSRA
jgi:hypothetical protein